MGSAGRDDDPADGWFPESVAARDWDRSELTQESTKHVSLWEKA